jgi:hypothetical protein
MRGRDIVFVSVTALLLVWTVLCTPALAHEPVFSIGPETIWQGGVGIETEFEFEQADGEHLSALHYEILYGLTENWSLQLSAPHILERKEAGNTERGLGDLEIRIKYQFFRKDLPGAQHKITGIGGIKLPTGDDDAEPALGTGSAGFLVGTSYGYESRTWYHFTTVRYRHRAKDGRQDPGDRLFLDAAIGYRPFQTEYTDLDAVLLLEGNYEIDFRDSLRGKRLPNTGGETFWLGPTALISPNPQWMFKVGIQFPVVQNLTGDRRRDDLRSVFGLEFHF